jgi:hypothetical protein
MKIVGCLSVSVKTFIIHLLTRNVLTEPLPSNGLFRVYSLKLECVFGEMLSSNELQLWLHYFGVQASCHSIYIIASGTGSMLSRAIYREEEMFLPFLRNIQTLSSAVNPLSNCIKAMTPKRV